jgi:serine/threonine-protein kinase
MENATESNLSKIINFIRQKDYKLIKNLGRGACAETVLLHDEIIDEKFVCKKYAPFNSEHKAILFKNFIDEIKLLFLLNHPNIVRVFTYYIYQEQLTGYILMEHVVGYELDNYLAKHPENINEVFLQVVEGFAYLEKSNILHRDIRPQNILVSNSVNVKIIDFGFGKQIHEDIGFDKSISLNWWCEQLPLEFKNKIYNFKTELYFVGKLFETIISDNKIEHFKHKNELDEMCRVDPKSRAESFASIRKKIQGDQSLVSQFDKSELSLYRKFSKSLSSVISKIQVNTKYQEEIDKIEQKLNEIFQNVMMEEHIPSNAFVTRCFLVGDHYYDRSAKFRVENLKGFLELLRTCSKEKRNCILRNLQTRLDAIPRYENDFIDEEIPF